MDVKHKCIAKFVVLTYLDTSQGGQQQAYIFLGIGENSHYGAWGEALNIQILIWVMVEM